jgi:hypothetical protein
MCDVLLAKLDHQEFIGIPHDVGFGGRTELFHQAMVPIRVGLGDVAFGTQSDDSNGHLVAQQRAII